MSLSFSKNQTLAESLSSAREPLWLCLHFARLALEVFELHDESRPVAVIEQRCVHCANRDNLPAGLALATAQALHPDLLALERKPERERDYLQQLAHWAYQFAPGVVIANRNSLLIEIGSCRRLYRGIRNLLKKMRSGLRQRQQFANGGLARTPKAAWLLAHCGCDLALRDDDLHDELLQAQIAAIPVDVLEIDEQAQQELTQMGLSTLGSLYALPKVALAKRFGENFIDYLEKIAGKKSDPQNFFTPAPRFQHGLAFIDGIVHQEMLLFPMKRLLRALDDYLRARQLHCQTLHWQLFDAHRLQAEFSIELSRAQNRWNTLLELSRLKLEQIALIESVFSIGLSCEDFFAAAPTAQQLFPDANDQREATAALIDRLQARLGNDALQKLTLQDSHWPEMASKYTEINKQKMAQTISRSTPSLAATVVGMDADTEPIGTYSRRVVASDGVDRHAPKQFFRPLWLLPQPQPLSQRDNRPCWPTPLTLLRGPERISNHWWQEEENERDYYIARNERGVVCWIYRERSTQRWFLHGLFA